MANPKNRVLRKHTGDIAKRLEALGLQVRQGPGRVWAWRGKEVVASFWWSSDFGWQMDLRSPPIMTSGDLDPAFHEIQRTMKARKRISDAWGRYAATKSEQAFMEYQGELAAYWLKIETQEENDGSQFPLGT